MRWRFSLSSRGATWALVGLLEAPLVGLWLWTQFFSPANISLVGDFAIADHNARLAQHAGMYVGVYDRYGWHHPGPILSYLQGGAYWLFGSSGRTLLATSIVIVAASIAGSAAVLIRNCSATAARLGVLGLGLFLVWMGTTTVGWASDSMGSLFLSPWNPDVVIAPTLLFVLLAPAARLRPWSLVGLLVLGSALVQADISCAPLVGCCTLAVLLVLVFGIRRDPAVRSAFSWSAVRSPLAVGIGALASLWALPLIQQLSKAPHNLSAILNFFINPPHEGSNGWLGMTEFWIRSVHDYGALRGSFLSLHVGVEVIGSVLVIGLGVVLWPLTTKSTYLRGLLGTVALGWVVSLIAINSITGPVFGYLIGWSMAVLAAIVVLLLGLLGDALDRPRHRRIPTATSSAALIGIIAVIVAFQLGGGLGLSSYDDRAVIDGVNKVVKSLPATPGVVELRFDMPPVLDPYYEGVFYGIANSLERRGFQIVLEPRNATKFGNGPYGLHPGVPTPIQSIRTVHMEPSSHVSLQHPLQVPPIWVTAEQPGSHATVPAP